VNLGLELEQAGAIPQTKLVSRFLLNIPAIFEAPEGEAFTKAVKSITKSLLRESSDVEALAMGPKVRSDFDDETIKAIMDVVDGVDKELLSRKDRKLLKLRLFFKPKDVISFLLRKGFSHEIFFE
jgi:flagellar biosynthesis protein FlhG